MYISAKADLANFIDTAVPVFGIIHPEDMPIVGIFGNE
ncbi:hypothetical protein VIC_001171 [Vibrio coralliilyticus ATCC BAA-450]|nr:hypothetical protein VIC_001171 [Vibrio coralliilyticus ATCC BAA-450]